jgi:hypothetical protein
VQAHTGLATECSACLVDEHGWLYLDTPLGLGLVHTLDVALAAQALEAGVWVAQPVQRSDLAVRYGYQLSPASHQ